MKKKKTGAKQIHVGYLSKEKQMGKMYQPLQLVIALNTKENTGEDCYFSKERNILGGNNINYFLVKKNCYTRKWMLHRRKENKLALISKI